jgi:hypothetical protein
MNVGIVEAPEAGAPEIEVTPAMIDAGVAAIFASDVWPGLPQVRG